jgi:hypothetical protein
VFYDKGSYSGNPSWRYLEAAPNDTTIRWHNGSNISTGATALGIGDGYVNTNAIITSQGELVSSYAAGFARAYTNNGYNDWFLPSKEELWQVWWNLVSDKSSANSGRGAPYAGSVAGFASKFCWSSSEDVSNMAWRQDFDDGNRYAFYKTEVLCVRPIRAF